MFIDEIKICARAGHGGKGCVAFRREKYRPKGGPDGGDGGRGGSVILQADHDLNNLIAQYYVPRLIAKDGEGGKGKGMDGHAGKDFVVTVPCGTLVWRLTPAQQPMQGQTELAEAKPLGLRSSASRRSVFRTSRGVPAEEVDLSAETDNTETSAEHSKGELVADLTEHGQQLVLCKGGRGG